MITRHGCVEPVRTPHGDSDAAAAVYALYWKDAFLGSCFAVAPDVLVSAGHHYNSSKDDVGDFTILVGRSKWMSVTHAAENSTHDVLVLWVGGRLEHYVSLRGFLPPVHSHVATVWLSPKPPHDPVISPGVVVESTLDNCTARGTVSTTGSSGAPVVDFYGAHVVGLHLTSDTREGSRVSGFLPARQLITLLAEMGFACRTVE